VHLFPSRQKSKNHRLIALTSHIAHADIAAAFV
jgi:hypothetical protein